jgi:hypothetical protein
MPQVLVAVDWTSFHDKKTLVASVITAHGRAIPVYYEICDHVILKRSQNAFELAFLTMLKTITPPSRAGGRPALGKLCAKQRPCTPGPPWEAWRGPFSTWPGAIARTSRENGCPASKRPKACALPTTEIPACAAHKQRHSAASVENLGIRQPLRTRAALDRGRSGKGVLLHPKMEALGDRVMSRVAIRGGICQNPCLSTPIEAHQGTRQEAHVSLGEEYS